MNPAAAEPTAPHPPRTMLKAVVLLALACGGVFLFVIWREGWPRSGSTWDYPRAKGYSGVRHPRLAAREMEAGDPLSVVAAYYDERAGIRGGDPIFMHRGGLFGSRSLVVKHSFSTRGAKPGTFLAHWKNRELALVQYWSPSSNAPARVLVSAVDSRFSDAWPSWNTTPAMQDLVFPGAPQLSSGSAGWMATTLHHTTNLPEVVWAHYLKKLPSGSNVLSAGAGTVFTNGISPAGLARPADLILMPVATTPSLEQRSLVHFWNSRLVFVWVWRASGDKETQILHAVAAGSEK